jgi:hypothetical protein
MAPGRRIAALLLACASSITLAARAAQSSSTPASQLVRLQQQLDESRSRQDWLGNLRYAKLKRELVNGAPRSQLDVARAELQLGRTQDGLQDLAVFARMGQAASLTQLFPEIAALAGQAAWREVAHNLEANQSEISRASLVFELSDPRMLAEDIDYDSQNQRFFISSVRSKKILTADLSGAARDFVRAPDGWPILALKVDSSRRQLWATEVALQGFEFAPKRDWGRSALVCFALNDGKVLRRIEGPRGSALGDLLLTPLGELIVSDNAGGAVYRLPVGGALLERVDAGDFVSPQTAAPHPDGKRLFVPDYLRGIALLDPASRQVHWLSMKDRFALNGIDGLYAVGNALVAVQNGTVPERVVVFRLNRALNEVISEVIVERASRTLGDPTLGVIVGTAFYYIANSGWDAIDERGELKPGTELSPARIMRVDLQQLR